MDAGGAGKYRGGSGCDYEVDIMTPATHSFRGEGLNYETGYGINGGFSGAEGKMKLRHIDGTIENAPKFGLRETESIRFITQSPGGGGYGSPLQRNPEKVLRDWRDGIISERAMREIYGVALEKDRKTVDQLSTQRLRKSKSDKVLS